MCPHGLNPLDRCQKSYRPPCYTGANQNGPRDDFLEPEDREGAASTFGLTGSATRLPDAAGNALNDRQFQLIAGTILPVLNPLRHIAHPTNLRRVIVEIRKFPWIVVQVVEFAGVAWREV